MDYAPSTEDLKTGDPQEQEAAEQRVWPLLVLQSLVRGAMVGSDEWTDRGTDLYLPPPVEAHLERILEPFSRDATAWEMGIQRTIRDGRIPIPWAIVAWEKEYPLGEHFRSIRGNDGKLPFASWCVDSNWDNSIVPPVSFILALEKAAFERAVKRSPMLEGAWDLLKDADAEGAWFCLAPGLDEGWVEGVVGGFSAA
jgi:hypothetical protein